jgi:tetratricopeptide (TPR) repeat protein
MLAEYASGACGDFFRWQSAARRSTVDAKVTTMHASTSPRFGRRAILLLLVPILVAYGASWVAATPEGLERSALIAYSEGRYDDASHGFVEAIRASESQSTPDPGLGQLLSDLAWLYHEQDGDAQADSLLRRALAVDQKRFGADALPTARRTQELGMLYQAEGRFKEAGPLLGRALSLYETNPKADARELAITQAQVGLNYQASGKLDRGEIFLKRALIGLDSGMGKDACYWAATLIDLAELYRASNRESEANHMFERALREAKAIPSAERLTSGPVCNPNSVLFRRLESIQADRGVRTVPPKSGAEPKR